MTTAYLPYTSAPYATVRLDNDMFTGIEVTRILNINGTREGVIDATDTCAGTLVIEVESLTAKNYWMPKFH